MALQLKSKDAARAALSLDGHVLRGRPLRVTHVKSLASAAKLKAPANASAAGAIVITLQIKSSRWPVPIRCHTAGWPDRQADSQRYTTLQQACVRAVDALAVQVEARIGQASRQEQRSASRRRTARRRGHPGWGLARRARRSSARRSPVAARAYPRPLSLRHRPGSERTSARQLRHAKRAVLLLDGRQCTLEKQLPDDWLERLEANLELDWICHV